MLTIDKPKEVSKSWPAFPYKGLSYYEPDDAPLFAGRDQDVVECATLLARSETRILVLQGPTGCGKSSFLRAGLIPYLEHDDLGFGFLKNETDGKLSAIFVRSTGKPLVELAKKVCDFINLDIKLKKSGKEEYYWLNLPEIVADYQNESEFVEEVSSDPELLIKVLGKIAVRLPKTLVLIIDQGEEVITLKPNVDDDLPLRRFFYFIELFSETCYDLKLLIALRTEYYGRFVGKMGRSQGASTTAQYYLDDLTKDQIITAIERPTSTEYVEGFGIPFEHYKFKYEKGLPEKIATDLLSRKLAGGILPVMQIVCDRLYQNLSSKTTESGLISETDYLLIGSIEVQIDTSLNATFADWCSQNDITSEVDIEKETDRWKDVLSNLAGSQSDGTVTTSVVTAETLRQWTIEKNCKLDFEKTIRHLVSVRILRDVEFFETRSESVMRYSLGHDAIGLALHNWQVGQQEVAGVISNIRGKLRVLGVFFTIFGVVSLFFARTVFSNQAIIWSVMPAVFYGLFFFGLSYSSRVPGLDRLFYSFLLFFPRFIPKNKRIQVWNDRKFMEIARRYPKAFDRFVNRVFKDLMEN